MLARIVSRRPARIVDSCGFTPHLVQIGSLRDQLFRQLREAGFIPTEAKLLNANVGNTHLLRCVICAALYPNVARLTQKGDSGDLVTISESVSFHPSSVNTRQSARSDRWFVYLEKVETSKVFLRDSTAVSAYALLLFGGQVDVVHDRDRIVVDRCVTLALHVHCSNEGRAEEWQAGRALSDVCTRLPDLPFDSGSGNAPPSFDRAHLHLVDHASVLTSGARP